MEEKYLFKSDELLKYKQLKEFNSGDEYLIVITSVAPTGQALYDYALLPDKDRDGLACCKFSSENVKKKRSDKPFRWIITKLDNGKVTLFSVSKRKYLNFDRSGTFLATAPQEFDIDKNGDFFIFSTEFEGQTWYLRAATRDESVNGLIFTFGPGNVSYSFAILERVYGISAKVSGKPNFTVGTYADIHIDYALETHRPFIRETVLQASRGFRQRYDLDAVILCGDSVSDNGSGYGNGALQGNWTYKNCVRAKKHLHAALRNSFRRDEMKKNIFHITGNHEYQAGARQPDGKKYNSGYYENYLPDDIQFPIYQDVDFDMGDGSKKNLLCYQYKVKNCYFLALESPLFPNVLEPSTKKPYGWYSNGHTTEQVLWLKERLEAIKASDGTNAVIFVNSHYPLYDWTFIDKGAKLNYADAFPIMLHSMMEFPNLFYFYGHVHGGDVYVCKTKTNENAYSVSNVEMSYAGEDNHKVLVTKEFYQRFVVRSDLIISTGFKYCYGGSMAFYKNSYFKNDGVAVNSWLSHIPVPFCQGAAVEIFDDRIIVTMNNFGKKKDLLDHVPNSKYKLEPMVYMLEK